MIHYDQQDYVRVPEAAVDLYQVDLLPIDANKFAPNSEPDNIHMSLLTQAVIDGKAIPLAQQPIRVESSHEDATIAYLPVYVRSVHAIRVANIQQPCGNS